MVGRRYVPDSGDLVWVNFNPQAGHEQAGHRPAIVLSPAVYNRKTSLALICPVTSKPKGYPFEVVLPPGLPIVGVALADQVRSLDWRARGARFVGRVSPRMLEEVRDRVSALMGR